LSLGLALRRRALGAALALGLGLVACGTPQARYDVIAPDVYVGAERSCRDLELSDVRCTAIILRAIVELDEARQGHAAVKSRSLHAEGEPPSGTTPAPRTQDLPAIVVFVLEDGQRVAIPIFCPRGGSMTDNACNPRVQ
jgi:hypothetical protein